MAFWASETLKKRVLSEKMVVPFAQDRINTAAYELSMGPEAFLTSTEKKTKIRLKKDRPLVVPAGQFAMLLTNEKVAIPLDAIGFISMRFSIKRKGLINVSGFHVDPGFCGRLKFSVYNAGSRDLTISRGDQIFMIWFADLDQRTTDGYRNKSDDQNSISSDDQNVMHGDVVSPAELKTQISDLKSRVENLKWIASTITTIAFSLALYVLSIDTSTTLNKEQFEEIKGEIVSESRARIEVVGEGGDAGLPEAVKEEKPKDDGSAKIIDSR